MKIASWNVNSIAIRLEQAKKWITDNDIDVLCLQETKCVDEKFPEAEFASIGYKSIFMGEKSYNGVAIVSKHKIEEPLYNFPDDKEDSPKRLIGAKIKGIRIVNTYIPNGTEIGSAKFDFKLDWLQRLRRMFDDDYKTSEKVLLCGDFNVAPDELDVWSVKNWEGKLHFTRQERAAIHHVKQWGFIDAYREVNGEKQEFSWFDYRTNAFAANRGLRIDHVWVSPALAKVCTNCTIDQEPRGWERPSDHCPVVGEFK